MVLTKFLDNVEVVNCCLAYLLVLFSSYTCAVVSLSFTILSFLLFLVERVLLLRFHHHCIMNTARLLFSG